MGNTLIQDSTTGHIMGLSEGFVPVGLKEHGGIMYIASVNKEGKGEIGTIPSPILTLSQNHPNDAESRNAILVQDSGPDHNLTILSDYKISPGEKFLIGLNLKVTPDYTWYNKPMITCFNGNTLVRGMYNIKLYTVYDTNSVCLDKLISTPQKYCLSNGDLNTSDYWFIPSDIITDIDIDKTYIAKEFKTYPGNIPAGRLAIKVELENIDSFSLMKSIQTQGVNAGEQTLAPRVTKNSDGDYILDFPGFDYKTSSARFVGKVEYCLYDQKTKQPLYNTNNQQTGELQVDENSTFKIIDRATLEEHYHIRRTINPIIPQPALFSYNIGSSRDALNNWYQIVVTYYDQFGGKIDTYKYSFNPYHVLTLEENYSLEWRQGLEYSQYYDWSKEATFTLSQGHASEPLFNTYLLKLTIPAKEELPQGISQADYRLYSIKDLLDLGATTYTEIFSESIAAQNDTSYIWKNPLQQTLNVHLKEFSDYNFSFSPQANGRYISPWTNHMSFKVILNGVESEYHIQANEWNPDINGDKLSVLTPSHGTRDFYHTYTLGSRDGGQLHTHSFELPICNNNILSFGWDLFPFVTTTTDYLTISNSSTELNHISGFDIEFSKTPDKPFYEILDLNVSNISDYTIIPNFALYGNSDTKFDIIMGLDRNGHPQPAWTFGRSLLTFVDLKPTSDQSSFVKTVEYLPETHSITQIIYPGTYLLNLNAYSDTGLVTITIDNAHSVDVRIGDRYFTPQLIYVSKDTKLTLSWSGIQKLRNIGLYQLSKPVWYADRTQFGENKVYDIKDYQHASLDVKSEVIIPLQASYYEKASCYGRDYDYYTGPVEAYMTDCHKLADGPVLSFVYTWNESDATKAQVGAIPDQLEEMSTLIYRNEKQ